MVKTQAEQNRAPQAGLRAGCGPFCSCYVRYGGTEAAVLVCTQHAMFGKIQGEQLIFQALVLYTN